jgi:amino acid transporter
MALNGVQPAQLVGRAVPLVFLIGFVGVGFIAYAFARLTRYFSHAGSVYVLAGRSLGPRAGFFGGFTLMGVYIVFAVSAFAATGLFFTTFLADVGVKSNVPWLLISLIVMALVLMVCVGQVRVATRTLLVFEAIGIVLVTILVVAIFVKIGAHSAPQHQTFDLHAFVPVAGFGPVIGASVYAFLSWAGFEGAATLGEETSNPKRNIPRAIVLSVGAIGVFYVIVMLAETGRAHPRPERRRAGRTPRPVPRSANCQRRRRGRRATRRCSGHRPHRPEQSWRYPSQGSDGRDSPPRRRCRPQQQRPRSGPSPHS